MDDYASKIYDIEAPPVTQSPPVPGASSYAKPGSLFNVTLHYENVFNDGDHYTIECGTFECDKFDYDDSGSGSIATIGLISTPGNTSLRRELKSKVFRNSTFEKLGYDIAVKQGFEFFYDAEKIEFDQLVQGKRNGDGEGDLEFLTRVAREYGLRVKVSDGKIIIFDEAIYEQKPPVFKVSKKDMGSAWLLSAKFSHNTTDTVAGAAVTVSDPKSAEVATYTFNTGREDLQQNVLVNTRPATMGEDTMRSLLTAERNPANPSLPVPVSDVGVAGIPARDPNYINNIYDVKADIQQTVEKQAKAAVRNANKMEITATFEFACEPRAKEAATIQVEGYGNLDGGYFIDEVTFNCGGGTKTTVKAHMILKGY